MNQQMPPPPPPSSAPVTDDRVMFNQPYLDAPRNRGTVAIRLILAIPHLIVASIWAYLAQIVAIVQWFIVLFTGKRNDGIWKLQEQWLGYATRTMTYIGLLHDEFPPFGTSTGNVPVTFDARYAEPASRLTNGLRFIWAIPAVIIAAVLAFAGYFVTIVAWFAIVITGSMPRGMHDFLVNAHRYNIRTQAYTLLMTDTYPSMNP